MKTLISTLLVLLLLVTPAKAEVLQMDLTIFGMD
jgi:hypothetical protein